MAKYGVISGPYFPVFGLNTEIITSYLDTFHAVKSQISDTIARSFVLRIPLLEDLNSGLTCKSLTRS